MIGDRRERRDRHALTGEGMVACNPRDKEATHRAEMGGIATEEAGELSGAPYPDGIPFPSPPPRVYYGHREETESCPA